MTGLSVGLRARLLLLVLLAVIPPFGVIGYSALNERRVAAERAEQEAMQLVRLAGLEQARLIRATHQLLADAARLPAVLAPQAPECSRTLARLKDPYPYYTNIGIADTHGDVVCSAQPLERPVNIADRSYFRRSVASGDFAIGDYQVGRITGTRTINLGYPVTGPDGALIGVIYAALSLGWIDDLVAGAGLPPGSTLEVVDSRGTVLTRYPDPQAWTGQRFFDAPLINAMLTSAAAGTLTVAGLDGVERLYAFAPLREGDEGNVHIAVGVPTEIAFAAANRGLRASLLLLAGAALLALAMAWLGSHVFVLRQVNALADATARLGRGDFDARTGLPHGDDELGRLARRFDEMAAALQRVRRTLTALSDGNRAMMYATDERELLERMCRITADVGRYPLVWVGYAEPDARGGLRLLAQAGSAYETDQAPAAEAAAVVADREAAAAVLASGAPRVEANASDGGACAMFPLRVRERVVGVLSIHLPPGQTFNAEELTLLEQAARDLGFGIDVVRTRAEGDRANATIRRMSYYDPLTGLPNHAQFEERLWHTLARARERGEPVALAVLDINRLREINDALGFRQGDRLLQDVGARVRAAVPDDIPVARLRGDEFAALIPAADAEHAVRLLRPVLHRMREPVALGDLTLEVNLTAGIALFPEHGTDPTHLMRCADVALQQAKKSGRDYAVYALERDTNSAQRLALAGELRHAIETGELLLHYQPKVEIAAERPCGAEALVRWRHPQRGLIPPDEFIALAEHTGLIKPLTERVLAAALAQAAAWHRAGLAIPVAVNLSPRNLRDAELLDKIQDVLHAHDARPQWLEIEITESAVMEDPQNALEILTRLRHLGIRLHIDDFGTGYSSLAYLKKLPVEVIKIDKSFVRGMLTEDDSAAIVRSIIDLAHDLGMITVAEGVETEAVRDRLATFGCDAAQGYYFSRPLPPEKLARWWERHAPRAPARRVAQRARRR